LIIVNFKFRQIKLTLQKTFKNETKMRKVDEDNRQYNDEWT